MPWVGVSICYRDVVGALVNGRVVDSRVEAIVIGGVHVNVGVISQDRLASVTQLCRFGVHAKVGVISRDRIASVTR